MIVKIIDLRSKSILKEWVQFSLSISFPITTKMNRKAYFLAAEKKHVTI